MKPITKANIKAKNIIDFLTHLKYDTPIIERPIKSTGDIGNSKFV